MGIRAGNEGPRRRWRHPSSPTNTNRWIYGQRMAKSSIDHDCEHGWPTTIDGHLWMWCPSTVDLSDCEQPWQMPLDHPWQGYRASLLVVQWLKILKFIRNMPKKTCMAAKTARQSNNRIMIFQPEKWMNEFPIPYWVSRMRCTIDAHSMIVTKWTNIQLRKHAHSEFNNGWVGKPIKSLSQFCLDFY